MVKLEVKVEGAWYKLDVPQSILNDVEDTERLKGGFCCGLIDVADFSTLAEWMKKHAYKHGYVLRTYYPDVREVPYDSSRSLRALAV